ncbi:N-acetyl-gamma-glutamyl-phosphate reductase [Dactylosporangium sucinum]|uniref:N-acetyl-gamma-glutamyl-phosphate reductase n=1 Tax=Dactylosporangium sucinum TaxID=1424081 RepID=A0A917WZA9_9ACTN|nr:N-acetyl-gamma-glutamyl-phosphate reductase [Dactylosporangium sucinum]
MVGASGYAGGDLLRIVAGHPHLELAVATGHAQAGSTIGSVHPHVRSFRDVVLAKTEPAALAGVDLVFLALPHGQSAAVAAQLPESVKVVDLGADFRLKDAAAWSRYYPGEHAGTWTYGLPELPGQRELIAAASRVASTGCYAVSTTLALAPLIAAGVADPEDVVVVAASGTTGAGRAAKQHLLASEVIGSLSPYKVGAHQHVPEIKQATGARTLSFTPVLAPMPRGILATVTARPTGDADPAEVLRAAYADEPFVHVLPPGEWPRTSATFGSNAAHLQATIDVDSGRIVVVSAIDNLGKGAAAQAVQNANLMLGLPETAGLAVDGVAP